MTDLVLKYNALNKTAQKQVNDFMDFLLSKQKNYKSKVNYKSRILSVSTWSDSDLEIFRNNQTLFNSWQIEEW
jgi:hypothetical protein